MRYATESDLWELQGHRTNEWKDSTTGTPLSKQLMKTGYYWQGEEELGEQETSLACRRWSGLDRLEVSTLTEKVQDQAMVPLVSARRKQRRVANAISQDPFVGEAARYQ